MSTAWWLIILAIVLETLGEEMHPTLRPFFYILAGICAVLGVVALIRSPKARHSRNVRSMSIEHKNDRLNQQELLSRAYSIAEENGDFGMMHFRYDTSLHNSIAEIHYLDGRQRVYTLDELGYSTQGRLIVYFDFDIVAGFASDHRLLLKNRHHRDGYVYESNDNQATGKYNTEKDTYDFLIYSPKYGRNNVL